MLASYIKIEHCEDKAMLASYIKIETVKLSDGSEVYDVIVPAMRLHTTTEKDAWNLLYKIYEAANSHTVDKIEMM